MTLPDLPEGTVCSRSNIHSAHHYMDGVKFLAQQNTTGVPWAKRITANPNRTDRNGSCLFKRIKNKTKQVNRKIGASSWSVRKPKHSDLTHKYQLCHDFSTVCVHLCVCLRLYQWTAVYFIAFVCSLLNILNLYVMGKFKKPSFKLNCSVLSETVAYFLRVVSLKWHCTGHQTIQTLLCRRRTLAFFTTDMLLMY